MRDELIDLLFDHENDLGESSLTPEDFFHFSTKKTSNNFFESLVKELLPVTN